MRPSAFIIRIPVKGFSKHDDPKNTERFFHDAVRQMLQRVEAFEGELPFDKDNITCEAEYGPGRSSEEAPPSCGADGERNKRRTRNRVGNG